ncbi:MAG: hypothetical protein EOO43_23385, partial [Flavobacterium sp.]
MNVIKKIRVFLFIGIVSVLFTSCQHEENEIVNPDKETLSKSAPLTKLLSRVAMENTTYDNVIDSTDCFKVKLPVNVVVNNQPMQVNSEADFSSVEAVFNDSQWDVDHVSFVFPITVIYPDYSEVIIASQQEFDNLSAACVSIPVEEQPIDCVTIVYPITIHAYNSALQLADTYEINTNAELFLFLENLSPNEYYSIQYPFSVINSQGNLITITGNANCQQVILEALNLCDISVVTPCEGNFAPFYSLYDSISNIEGVMETTIWSAETHEYAFSMNTNGTLCIIGYESPSIGGEYVLEILNENGAVLYSGSHSFDADVLTYVSIDPVDIIANQKYILRRKSINSGTLCKALVQVENGAALLPTTNNG